MLLCTFSSHKVPKLIQSHLRFPPSPSQILPLCPGISKVLFYLTSFWNASSPSVLRGLLGYHLLWNPFEEKLFCLFTSPCTFTLPFLLLVTCLFHPLKKSLLLRAPANQIYYSVPILVSIICQTLARLQSCTPGSQISLDHTLINFDAPLSLPSIIALLNSLPSYPAKSSSEILFPVLQIPSIPLFLSPTIKLMDKMAYLGLQLSSWIFLKKNYPTQLTGFTLNSWLQALSRGSLLPGNSTVFLKYYYF